MCSANLQEYITLPNGNRRNKDGSLTPASQTPTQVQGIPQPRAVDVPMGEGDVGAARRAILTRRERIRQGVEGT